MQLSRFDAHSSSVEKFNYSFDSRCICPFYFRSFISLHYSSTIINAFTRSNFPFRSVFDLFFHADEFIFCVARVCIAFFALMSSDLVLSSLAPFIRCDDNVNNQRNS